MFNNNFQAILLLVTFTIRRKKIFHEITLETAAQTSVSPFHHWICSGRSWFCHCRGALSFGAVSATRACNISSTGACALFHHLRGHRKADVCHWEPEGPWLPTVHWAPLPRRAPVPLLLEKPLQLILQRRGGHCSAHPAELPILPQTTEHTCRFCSYVSKFLSEGFSTPFSHPPAQGAVTDISSWGHPQQSHTHCTFLSFASSVIYFHKNWLIDLSVDWSQLEIVNSVWWKTNPTSFLGLTRTLNQ